MGMSDAERQARHRKRVKERIRQLQEEVVRLRAMVGRSKPRGRA
jgi:hypothetical protein